MSCGPQKTSETDHSGHDMSMKKEGMTEMQASMLLKDKAKEIISAYLALKEALVQTDAATASLSAKAILVSLEGSEDELADKIKTDAEHISGTGDVEHQRKHFGSLSDNVYTLIKTTEANDAPLYRQYCPMAFDNAGGYWISSEKEVLNPYFGDKMLKCGSVKEEL